MAKIAILLATLGAAAAAAATSSLAPRVDQLPDCSIQCITDGAADFGCQLTDFNCLCSQLEDLVAQVSPCLVHAGCGMTEVTDTATFVFKLCESNSNSSDSTGTVENFAAQSSDPASEEDAASSLRHSGLAMAMAIAMAAAMI
jgi:hypothetical protein